MARRTVSSGASSDAQNSNASNTVHSSQGRTTRSTRSSSSRDAQPAASAARRSPATGQFATAGRTQNTAGARRLRNNTSRQTASQIRKRTITEPGPSRTLRSTGSTRQSAPGRRITGSTRTDSQRSDAAQSRSLTSKQSRSAARSQRSAGNGVAGRSSAESQNQRSGRLQLRNLFRRRKNAAGRNDGHTPRSSRSDREVTAQSASASRPGGFVDGRRLKSEDVVAKTLNETTSGVGLATRPKIVDFKARQKERRTARAKVIAIRAGIVTAVVAAVIALIWLLFFSPVLRLEADHITAEGANGWVSEEQILSIADQQEGKSLLVVSDKEVISALEAIPGVSSATVTKHFPNSLTVSVTAQRPAAMLKVNGSSELTAVDNQGRILNSVDDSTSTDGIPVITVSNVNDALSDKAILNALVILDSLSESMRQSITSVTADTQDSVTTVLSPGITVLWGDAADIKLKSAIVDKIINDPDVIGTKTQIDVSAPSRPIIK